ncbi:MAG: DUF3597 domain-containing protein [Allosphingosinicella sp.]
MGIFSSIKDAIFGRAHAAPATPDAGAAPAEAQGGWSAVTGEAPVAAEPVDVEAVLREKMAAKGNPDLNYHSSIVDLMKLLDLDSSLASRGQLAEELGYTGAKDGSAEMNIWLHRKVIEELERHGGQVPQTMKS